MLSAWSVGLANEIQSEKTFATKSGQHRLIQGEEHPAHDLTNTTHLLSNKRGNQFNTYQEKVSYSDYCKLLLASLCRARRIPCQHFRWVSTAFITHRHLPIDIAHCHRHCTLSSPFTKSQRTEKKSLIKSHVVRSEIPRYVKLTY